MDLATRYSEVNKGAFDKMVDHIIGLCSTKIDNGDTLPFYIQINTSVVKLSELKEELLVKYGVDTSFYPQGVMIKSFRKLEG